MRILKIIHGYPPHYNAGSEVYTQTICNELKKENDILVFTREENEYIPDFQFREEQRDGIKFIFVNMALGKDGYNHPLLNERFKKLVIEFHPEIAHIGHLNHLSTGIVDVLYELKIPTVYTLHDFWLMCPRGQFIQRNFEGIDRHKLCDGQDDNKCASKCYGMYFSGVDEVDQKNWANWIGRRMAVARNICNKIDLFIAPSKYLMLRFINQFSIPKEKIVYLDYGFPTHYLTPSLVSVERESFNFGYIGTHIPSKGINHLIEAFSGLQGNTRLMIWGRNGTHGSYALRRLAESSPNPVEFPGEYVNSNLADVVFSKIDCLVVPSIWAENSPLVIHEAQACKIPVITANYGGMAEYVHHDINGLLFSHRDPNDLQLKMQYALDHISLMKELGSRGYLNSPDGKIPDVESHCKELINIYNQLSHAK